jgi:DNA-binding SARP family transcriptional activator/tetratricopeptide (TPR) repeat protein
MPPRYFLRCLGSPELRGPTGEPIRIRTRKHFALLIYLAVEPRQHHRRERLADLLWPNASLAEGRHSLATALSMIRGKLGPRSYESTRDTVKLITPDLELDLDRLIRGEVLGDEYTPPLEMGGFLDEFEVPTSPEFMHWRDQRRAQLFPTIRSAFVTLMDRRRRTGAFSQIEPLADRLLELDPLSEEAIRAKMEGRAFAGDRISALRIYQTWKERLHTELGASPSMLIEGMALRLRQRGYEAPGTANVPTVQTDQWRDAAFIGRGEEYNSLYERWEKTKNGESDHAIVLGESGIGKTTLFERLITAAGLEGAVSARVQCYEVEKEIPYAAISTLVRGMIDRPGSSATPPEWLAELSSTVPVVSQVFTGLPKPWPSAGETTRLRLVEALNQLAASVSEENPLILVIDDAHLADDASLAVLHLLMRRTQKSRVMLLFSARPQELKQSPGMSRLMETGTYLSIASIELPSLSDHEVELMIRALASGSQVAVPAAVHRSLARAASGNPMVLELLFDDWREHGAMSLALSVSAMTADASSEGENHVANQVFERVIRDLGEVSRSVLSMAALLGERLNDLTMYELVDLSLGQTLNGMTELADRRILRDGGKGLEFRNELLRTKAYYAVPAALRRSFHGLIADRLLAARDRGETVPGLMLAWHCFRAGRQEQASSHLFRGADEAMRRGAVFDVELALTSAIPSLVGGELCQAQLLLSEAYQGQGRWAQSLEVLRLVEPVDEIQRDHRDSMRLQAACWVVDDEPQARELLREVRSWSHSAPVPTQVNLLAAAQRLILFLADSEEAGKEVLRARDLLPRLQSLADRVAGYAVYTALCWLAQRESWTDTTHALQNLVRECQEAGLLDSNVAKLYKILGCALMALGRYKEALGCHERAWQLARMHGDEVREADSADNISLCHGRLGNYADQAYWAECALSLYSLGSGWWLRTRASLKAIFSLCMRGENRKALEKISEILESCPKQSLAWVEQALGLLSADILLLCGQAESAFRLASRTFDQCGYVVHTRAYCGPIARWAALIYLRRHDFGAKVLLDGLYVHLKDHDMIDQAEILAARIGVFSLEGKDCYEERRLLAEKLVMLPPAVENQIQRLQWSN